MTTEYTGANEETMDIEGQEAPATEDIATEETAAEQVELEVEPEASGEDEAAEAVYAYHKCLTEISGNAAYAMVFQSFEKMIRNLIREHYKNASELTRSLPKFTLLTEAVARRDAFEADRCILSVLEQASDYLNTHLKSREAGRGE